jgi:hypothetical protein
MRFVIEVPDELLRGMSGPGAAQPAPAATQLAPLSGGAAADGASSGNGTLAQTFSAGPAEGGGVRGALDDRITALDGGAAPEERPAGP